MLPAMAEVCLMTLESPSSLHLANSIRLQVGIEVRAESAAGFCISAAGYLHANVSHLLTPCVSTSQGQYKARLAFGNF